VGVGAGVGVSPSFSLCESTNSSSFDINFSPFPLLSHQNKSKTIKKRENNGNKIQKLVKRNVQKKFFYTPHSLFLSHPSTAKIVTLPLFTPPSILPFFYYLFCVSLDVYL
jgi:hypothetical protein